MSDVKLYVCQTNMNGVVLAGRPATTAEIMASHPKCGECFFVAQHNNGITNYWQCHNDESECCEFHINPTTDYCRHWEAKG